MYHARRPQQSIKCMGSPPATCWMDRSIPWCLPLHSLRSFRWQVPRVTHRATFRVSSVMPTTHPSCSATSPVGLYHQVILGYPAHKFLPPCALIRQTARSFLPPHHPSGVIRHDDDPPVGFWPIHHPRVSRPAGEPLSNIKFAVLLRTRSAKSKHDVNTIRRMPGGFLTFAVLKKKSTLL